MSESAHPVTSFTFKRPDKQANKIFIKLARTDRLASAIQIVQRGGENNLHSHAHQDGFWFVLKGRVRFYGDEDVVIGEYAVHEGILIPRGVPYWFENASEDEELHLLQVEAFDIPLGDYSAIIADRINHRPLKENLDPSKVEFMDAAR